MMDKLDEQQKPDENFFAVLSTAKVALAGVPAFTEYSGNLVIIGSHKTHYAGCQYINYRGHPNCGYCVMTCNGEISTTDLIKKMKSQNTNVAICPSNSALFSQVINNEKTKVIISACREGLLTTYMPLLEKLDREITVISIDNDETIVERAKQICNNKKITFCKAVIHIVCTEVDYDKKTHTINLEADDQVEIIFPPAAKHLKPYFCDDSKSIYSLRTKAHFTDTDSEFQFYSRAKIVDVNGMHTLISIIAYKRGFERGLTVNDIAESTFDTFISEKEAMILCETAHSEMYDNLMNQIGTKARITDKKKAHAFKMKLFVHNIFLRQEKVSRGINLNDTSSTEKLKRHLELLKDVKTNEISNYIEFAMRISISYESVYNSKR